MWRTLDHELRRTTLLFYFYASIVLGIGIAHIGIRPSAFLYFAPLIIFFPLRRVKSWRNLAFILIIGLILGLWRGHSHLQNLLAYNNLYNHKVSLSVRALNDGVYGKTSQLVFDADKVTTDKGRRILGKLYISCLGMSAVFQGDTVLVSGKLRSGFGAYQGAMSFASAEVISHHDTVISEVRRRFVSGTQSALPEPIASFSLGLLVGQRSTLPTDVKQDLLMVGLTHIIAVSGYNLTIILRASKGVLGKHSKRLSTLFALSLIGVFLLITGMSASIVRASIVSLLSIYAAYYGRAFKPLNLIMLAAAITAWANPVYVWSDAGWYLSFLAFFGVMVLAPLLATRLHLRWRESVIVMVALESICAEIMTMPYVLHVFGQISFVGLPANILVAIFIPLAMLLGLIAGLAGMLLSAFAGWFAWPAQLLMTYMLDIAHILASMPQVFKQNLSLSVVQMLGLYVLSAGLTSLLWFKNKQKSAENHI